MGTKQKAKTIIGIDPGQKGGIAFLFSNGELGVYNMPLKKYGTKKELDNKKVAAWLRGARLGCFAHEVVAVIEEVSAENTHGRKQGAVGMFRFGQGYGQLLAVLDCFDIPTVRVKPAVWKSAMGLGRDKMESIALARRLFPKFTLGDKDDGPAEALLLAYFGRERLIL